jgi:hypothetical protein
MDDKTIITWVIATGLHMCVTESTNQMIAIRDDPLVESMSRWEDRTSHGKMK